MSGRRGSLLNAISFAYLLLVLVRDKKESQGLSDIYMM